MNQRTLIKDLKKVEEMAVECHCGTNCFIHLSRIRELAENGYYHLDDKR